MIMTSAPTIPRNKTDAKQQRTVTERASHAHREIWDLITPHWRKFFNEHCWPAWRLDRCSLDELRRLQTAVPYLQAAIDAAVRRKEAAR